MFPLWHDACDSHSYAMDWSNSYGPAQLQEAKKYILLCTGMERRGRSISDYYGVCYFHGDYRLQLWGTKAGLRKAVSNDVDQKVQFSPLTQGQNCWWSHLWQELWYLLWKLLKLTASHPLTLIPWNSSLLERRFKRKLIKYSTFTSHSLLAKPSPVNVDHWNYSNCQGVIAPNTKICEKEVREPSGSRIESEQGFAYFIFSYRFK